MEPLTFSVDPRRGLVLNKDAADRGTQNYVVVDPVVGRHLKRHQIEALLWLMSTLFGSCSIDESAAAAPAAAAPGAILAYSMGLGKTIVIIAFLFTILNQSRADTGRGEVQKAVIIAPASVSQQWLQEFFKWLGRSRLRVTIAHDLAGIESFRASRTQQVLIVSMQLFLKHSEIMTAMADVGLWVVDEAHQAVGPEIHAAASKIKEPLVMLTGTPLGNSVEEFVQLHKLAGRTMIVPRGIESACKELLMHGDGSDTPRSKKMVQDYTRRAQSKMLCLLSPSGQLNLPSKSIFIIVTEMTTLQQALYEFRVAAAAQSDGQTDPFLSMYSALGKITSHPSLYLSSSRGDITPSSGGPENGAAALVPADYQENDPGLSAKTEIVLRVAAMGKKRGDCVIVASRSTSVLDLVGGNLKNKGFLCLKLTGETPMSDRGSIVRQLNDPSSEVDVLLLSIKAGGTGLNLTGANILILYEPSLNPSVDEQAIARIYRPGQLKDVFIYRLVSGDTGAIEMQVMILQLYKKALARLVLQGERDQGLTFQERDDGIRLPGTHSVDSREVDREACTGRLIEMMKVAEQYETCSVAGALGEQPVVSDQVSAQDIGVAAVSGVMLVLKQSVQGGGHGAATGSTEMDVDETGVGASKRKRVEEENALCEDGAVGSPQEIPDSQE